MIKHRKGDLFATGAQALVNPVNCVGVMGAGVAKDVRARWPEVFRAYARECAIGHMRIGVMHAVPTGAVAPAWVINFPTKHYWWHPSELDYIRKGLVGLKETIRQLDVRSIAVPYLGTGKGGLPRAKVQPLIESHLSDLDNVRVILVEQQ